MANSSCEEYSFTQSEAHAPKHNGCGLALDAVFLLLRESGMPAASSALTRLWTMQSGDASEGCASCYDYHALRSRI